MCHILKNRMMITIMLLLLCACKSIKDAGQSLVGNDEAPVSDKSEVKTTVAPKSTIGGVEVDARVLFLSPEARLRKVTFLLTGRYPSDVEIDRVANQGELGEVIEELLDSDAFITEVKEIFHDLLLHRKYGGTARRNREDALGLLDAEFFPNKEWYNDESVPANLRRRYGELSNDALINSATELIGYIVKNNRPFTDILTADFTMVNPFSAKVFGVTEFVSERFTDETDPSEFKPVKLPGIPHSGILTDIVFLNRYPTSDNNTNRHRSKIIYLYFLDTDILLKADRNVDVSKADIGDNPTMNNEACSVCHVILDPIAGAFKNFDDEGRYFAKPWFPVSERRPPGFEEKIIEPDMLNTSLQWLGKTISADPRFAKSIVKVVFKGLTGIRPILPPVEGSPNYVTRQAIYDQQNGFFSRTADAFMSNDYNLKAIVKAIINSPYFVIDDTVEALAENEQQLFAQFGRSRLLGPEKLSQKVTSIFGSPWSDRRGNDLLKGMFKKIYGGLDYIGTTKRLQDPSGLMNNVSIRMAIQLACMHVGRDFSKTVKERRLFQHVGILQTPEGSNILPIKQNIQHLHKLLLSEDLSIDHPEIERTFQLFSESWEEGKAKVDAAKVVYDALDANAQNATDPSPEWKKIRMLPQECRVRNGVAVERRVESDDNYVARSWMAVITFLVSDFRFLYE